MQVIILKQKRKNKYFFDEIYDKTFVRFTKILTSAAGYFDVKIIDRFGPNGFSHFTRGLGWCVCQIQTGYIFNYALYIIFALVLCITIFIFKYLRFFHYLILSQN